MGYPVPYPEVSLPKIFLHILPLLASLISLTNSILSFFHLSDTDFSPSNMPEFQIHRPTLSAILIREFLPVINFRDLTGDSPAVGCAVCLNEFAGEDEIRCMENCRHIYHRMCVDRWIDYDQRTCPLCRTEFVPYRKMEDYNQRLWDENDDSIFAQHDYNNNFGQ